MLCYLKKMCYYYVTAVSLGTNFIKYRKREHIMKKKLAALFALALSVAALTACGAAEGTSEVTSESVQEMATFTPSVNIVEVEGDVTDLSLLPVEDYVSLGKYKGLTLNVSPMAEVTEEQIESAVLDYYYQHGNSNLTADEFLTEGTVADTDIVLIDYVGKKDGVAFEGGTAEGAILGIGSNSFIDGFESGLIGVTVGETVDLNLTFPEAYQSEELAGQDVVFTVTVKGLLSFNDDTIKKFAIMDIDTAERYRSAVAESLKYEAENVYTNELNTAIVQGLMDVCIVTKIPKSVFDYQKAAVKEQIEFEATNYYSVDAEFYAQIMGGMSLDDYTSAIAESYAIQGVIFQAIANKEDITITQEDVDTFVANYVDIYGESQGIESVEQFYENNSVEDVKAVLLQNKIISFITENAKIVEK